MNERIDQLWAQALDAAVPETYTQLSHSQVLKVKQVFAELIVRECMEQIHIHSRGPCGDYHGEWYESDILKHFGVEE
jgi:hypothetical protein